MSETAMTRRQPVEVADGCMWEEDPWRIVFENECEAAGGCKPCKHCHSERLVSDRRVWICPRVVVAENEGGYGSTGVCLDCILDAAKALEGAPPVSA